MESSRTNSKWNTWPALTLITIAATWLRLHGIGDKSFWTDEGISAAFTSLGWYDLLRILWRREGNMALYYLLLRGWSHLGDSEAMLRGFSALWSVATVPVLFLLGRKLFGEWTGAAAALLWSVNAYAVRYAQEARSYSLVAFLVTCAVYFLVSALGSERKRDWSWFVALAVLAIYAHFFAVLVLVAMTFALWNSPVKAELLGADKRIALFTLPVWIFIATTGAGPINWIPRPNLHGMWIIFGDYAGHGGLPLTLLYLLGIGLAAFTAWRFPARQSHRLLLAWFLLPIGITFVVSLAKPVLMPRYLFICIPALVLLVAAGLSSLSWRWIAVPLLAVICWLSLGGVRNYYERDFDLTREDFRGAASYILSHAEPGDVIAFHKGQNRFAYGYYAERATIAIKPSIVYPGADQPTWHDFASKVTPQTLDAIREHHGRIWLLISENMSTSGEDAVAQELKQAAGEKRELVQQQNFTALRAYLFRTANER
jgi:hypothetical protein